MSQMSKALRTLFPQVNMRKILLVSLFLFGIFFRIGSTYLFPQPFVFDEWDYDDIARDIIAKKEYQTISAYNAYRTVGYPIILAAVYYFFGRENQLAWVTLQAILDTMVAIFLFIIARRIFTSQVHAWMAFFIYLINPFTMPYVGLRLTEIMAIFFLVLVFLLNFQFLATKDPKLIVFLGFALGYLPQVRPSFMLFCLTFMIFLIHKIGKVMEDSKYKKNIVLILFLVFFSLPLGFNLFRNLKYYHRFSFSTADNVFIKELYISLFMEREYGTDLPPEVNMIHQEYSLAPDKEQIANKYKQLIIENVKKDPSKFVLDRFKKIWYIWEKHQIFPYINLQDSRLISCIYWTNIGFLMMGLLGFFLYCKDKIISRKKNWWFIYFSGFLFIYLSLVHSLTHASERFSIPAYPFIALFAAYAIWRILGRKSKTSFPHD